MIDKIKVFIYHLLIYSNTSICQQVYIILYISTVQINI